MLSGSRPLPDRTKCRAFSVISLSCNVCFVLYFLYLAFYADGCDGRIKPPLPVPPAMSIPSMQSARTEIVSEPSVPAPRVESGPSAHAETKQGTNVAATVASAVPAAGGGLSSPTTLNSLRLAEIPLALLHMPQPNYVELSRTILLSSFCHGKPAETCLYTNNREEVCTNEAALRTMCSGAVPGASIVALSATEAQKGQHACVADGFSPCRFYSQMHEDAVLYDMFFRKKTEGVYLELGALDGLNGANTKFYEETLGWTGVLIEGSPQNFQKLQVNRATAANVLVHAPICDQPKLVRFFERQGVSGIVDNMSVEHVNDYFKNKEHGQVQLMCRRLDEVLKAVSVKKIDLWVLDVEGAEIEVLRSFDWESVPVHVLIIERNHKDHDVEALLFRQGFEYVREQRGNRVWVNPKYLDL